MKSRFLLSTFTTRAFVGLAVGLASCSHQALKPTTAQQSTREYQKTMDTMKRATSDLQNTLDEKKAPLKK